MRMGCGLTRAEGALAVYFTWEGVRLPGVRVDALAKDTKFYPILSLKGKLCHVELLKQVSNFAAN